MTLLSLASKAPRALLSGRQHQQQKRKQASSSPPLPSSLASPPPLPSSLASPPPPKTTKALLAPRGRSHPALRPPASSRGGGSGGGFPLPRGDGEDKRSGSSKSGEEEEEDDDLLLSSGHQLLSSPPPSPSPPVPLVPVRSRDAERTVGRKAMLGFACACVGEVLAGGGGPLSQLTLSGLLPSFALDALLAGACASGLLFALSPVSRAWNDTAVREALLSSSRSPVSKPSSTPASASPAAKAAMYKVLAGRFALVGLLFLVVVERQTGGAGALEQLGLLPPSVAAASAATAQHGSGARALLLWLSFAVLAWTTRFRSTSVGGGGGAGKKRR